MDFPIVYSFHLQSCVTRYVPHFIHFYYLISIHLQSHMPNLGTDDCIKLMYYISLENRQIGAMLLYFRRRILIYFHYVCFTQLALKEIVCFYFVIMCQFIKITSHKNTYVFNAPQKLYA